MKPSLERTAVLSKDLTEQDDSYPCIVMIPDVNIVLAADKITHENGEIQVIAGEKTIAQFSSELTWICIDRNCVDVVKREDQLRRHMANVQAEEALMETLSPGTLELAKKAKEKDTITGSERWGQYL
jgi:hypothetical protein